MTVRRAPFTQSDLTKVLKAFRDAGFPPPVLIIEPQRITAKPNDGAGSADLTGWEDVR